MAGSALEEREDHVLEGHLTTLPEQCPDPAALKQTVTAVPRSARHRVVARYLGNYYLGSGYMRQYGGVVESRPPDDGGGALQPGAELRVSVGLRLDVPPGQSVALLSQPQEAAVGSWT